MATGLLVIRLSRPFASKSAANWVMKMVLMRLDGMFADEICEIAEPHITNVSSFERIRRAKSWLSSLGNIPGGQGSIITNTHASANLQINSVSVDNSRSIVTKKEKRTHFYRFLQHGWSTLHYSMH